MADLIKKYEVKVVAEYWTTEDIIADNEDDALSQGTHMFYDDSHRAEIYSAEISDEYYDCDDCGADHCGSDHECEDDE